MREPCSAPDIAGQGKANPTSLILSAAMLLDWLGAKKGDERCAQAAAAVRQATGVVLAKGPKTADLGGNAKTMEVAQAIADALPVSRVAA